MITSICTIKKNCFPLYVWSKEQKEKLRKEVNFLKARRKERNETLLWKQEVRAT